ncbi:MAG: hypothetical protein K0S17_125 [Enterobacter mori]|nr:hypothetical protein [Enterobacter mori]
MYQDLIRNELNEAAESKPVAKCSPAVTVAPTVTPCTSPKS